MTLALGLLTEDHVEYCLTARAAFQLSEEQAVDIIEHQVRTIAEKYPVVCAAARLSEVDQRLFWRLTRLDLAARKLP